MGARDRRHAGGAQLLLSNKPFADYYDPVTHLPMSRSRVKPLDIKNSQGRPMSKAFDPADYMSRSQLLADAAWAHKDKLAMAAAAAAAGYGVYRHRKTIKRALGFGTPSPVKPTKHRSPSPRYEANDENEDTQVPVYKPVAPAAPVRRSTRGRKHATRRNRLSRRFYA